jgi:hypothetical protein
MTILLNGFDGKDNKLAAYIAPSMGVAVGILENAQDYAERTSKPILGYSSKVVMVAAFHEYAPESNYNKWLLKSIAVALDKDEAKHLVKAIKISKDSPRKRRLLLNGWGEFIAEEVKDVIHNREVKLAANSAETLLLKDGSIPMVDTKHLTSVIDSEPVK